MEVWDNSRTIVFVALLTKVIVNSVTFYTRPVTVMLTFCDLAREVSVNSPKWFVSS